MLLHDLSVQDGTLYGSTLALGGSPCQLPVQEHSWQCTPTQGFLLQECLPILADIALDAVMLLLGCSFSDQEDQLEVYWNPKATVLSVSWHLCSCAVAAAVWRSWGELGNAGPFSHGARCELSSLPHECLNL